MEIIGKKQIGTPTSIPTMFEITFLLRSKTNAFQGADNTLEVFGKQLRDPISLERIISIFLDPSNKDYIVQSTLNQFKIFLIIAKYFPLVYLLSKFENKSRYDSAAIPTELLDNMPLIYNYIKEFMQEYLSSTSMEGLQ